MELTPWNAYFNRLPTNMMKTEVELVDLETCNDLSFPGGGPYIFNMDQVFCAGHRTSGRNTCQGDSGGPAMARVKGVWKVAGIVSYADGCARAKKPTVFTRVSYYSDWLRENGVEL